MTGWQLAFGGLVLVGGGYLTGGTLAVHSAAAALVLAYLTLLSSIAFALWSVLLKHNRVSMIAPFNFVVPAAGTVLSAIFLGENILELKYAVALALVCTGIWWVNKPGKASRLVRLAGKQHLLAAAGIDGQPGDYAIGVLTDLYRLPGLQ